MARGADQRFFFAALLPAVRRFAPDTGFNAIQRTDAVESFIGGWGTVCRLNVEDLRLTWAQQAASAA